MFIKKEKNMNKEHPTKPTVSILHKEAQKVMSEMGIQLTEHSDIHAIFKNYRKVVQLIIEKKPIPIGSPDAKTLKEMRLFFGKLHQNLRTVVELMPLVN